MYYSTQRFFYQHWMDSQNIFHFLNLQFIFRNKKMHVKYIKQKILNSNKIYHHSMFFWITCFFFFSKRCKIFWSSRKCLKHNPLFYLTETIKIIPDIKRKIKIIAETLCFEVFSSSYFKEWIKKSFERNRDFIKRSPLEGPSLDRFTKYISFFKSAIYI